MRTRPRYLADTNIFLFFAFAFLAITISMNVSSSRASAAENEMRQKPTVNTDMQNIESTIATMGDEQVRRLLIKELKSRAEQEKVNAGVEEELTGVAGSIQKIKDLLSRFRARIDALRYSEHVDIEKDLPNIYTFIGTGEHGASPIKTILSVILVFLTGLLINWVFGHYVFFAKSQIEGSESLSWAERLAGLTFRALWEVLSVIIFVVVVIASSFLFLELTPPQRMLIATYLAAFVIVQLTHLLLKFLLAPHVPGLRILPISDQKAIYLHRWLIAIVIVGSFGLFTCGVFRLAGLDEANHYLMVTLVSIVMSGMFVVMILQNKQLIARMLSENKSETSLQFRLAQYWHHFAIVIAVLIALFSMIQRLFFGIGAYSSVKTGLIIGLYLLFDWLLRMVLRIAFGIAKRSDDLGNLVETVKRGALSDGPETINVEAKDELALPKKTTYVSRMKSLVRIGLRIALLVYMVFWVMRAWGFQFTFGETVSHALFSILITVLVCYIAWELINTKIQQKLKDDLPDSDEEMEEGGAGGSRIGTLLLLLQKFFIVVIVVMVVLVVLSSLGVDIGPLIAGAGIVGLAIGMGAQTLVRDIIAGIFFLIDDAFRVGDYVDVGGTKGMVEKISIRSFKLRHPRGMVNTIPFGDIGTVTNFSRDYIITKLDFRVRYDTDVEKIRKIIKKKVYQVIEANEELGPKLLAPIKSQGVREMDDSAMIMRVKYKTAPGEQFAIRKEVYRLLQEAFKEEGIEFAHKNVTVYMPSESTDTGTGDTGDKQEIIRQAAAAAALTAEQSNEKELKKP